MVSVALGGLNFFGSYDETWARTPKGKWQNMSLRGIDSLVPRLFGVNDSLVRTLTHRRGAEEGRASAVECQIFWPMGNVPLATMFVINRGTATTIQS